MCNGYNHHPDCECAFGPRRKKEEWDLESQTSMRERLPLAEKAPGILEGSQAKDLHEDESLRTIQL